MLGDLEGLIIFIPLFILGFTSWRIVIRARSSLNLRAARGVANPPYAAAKAVSLRGFFSPPACAAMGRRRRLNGLVAGLAANTIQPLCDCSRA